MILLGLLLLCATGAFTGLLVAENLDGGPRYTVTMFGNDLATMNSLAVFLAGIALTLLFGLGLFLAAGGLTRRRHHRTITPHPTDTAGPSEPDMPAGTPQDTATPADRPHSVRRPHRRPHFGH